MEVQFFVVFVDSFFLTLDLQFPGLLLVDQSLFFTYATFSSNKEQKYHQSYENKVDDRPCQNKTLCSVFEGPEQESNHNPKPKSNDSENKDRVHDDLPD